MALRLRRGTDAERLLITPVEGELIYTTDTKLLYAGDGTTAGGTLVAGAGGGGSTTLDALTDTDLTGVADNDVLTYNSGTNKWESVAVPGVGVLAINDLSNVSTTDGLIQYDLLQYDGVNFVPKTIDEILTTDNTLVANTFGVHTGTVDGDLTGSVFGDNSTLILDGINNTLHGDLTGNVTGNLTGNVTGNVTGELQGNTFGSHIGTVDGELSGSVFGDDSTLIIDGINNTISTIAIRATQVNTNLINRGADNDAIVLQNNWRTPLRVVSVTDGSLGGFPYTEYLSVKGTVDTPQSLVAGDVLGGWKITGYDGANEVGKIAALWISAFEDDAVVTDNYPKSSATLLISKGGNTYNQFMFGSEGEFKAPGAITPGVFADAAARDAGITTPTAGMMVFVTDVAKFQGYAGGAWANLN